MSSHATRSLWSFFMLAFGFAWLCWLPAVLASFGLWTLPVPHIVPVIIGAHGPLVAAVALTYQAGGWAAVKQLLRAGFNLRLAPVWWLVGIGLPVVLTGLAVWLNSRVSGYEPDTALLAQPLMIVPTFLTLFFVGGSVQEEFGWRGYALPRLLTRWNPLSASLILGVIWGGWHWPLFYVTGVSQAYMSFGVFFLLTTAFSLVFTLIFLRTKRNLFSALLLHTAINTAFALFPPFEQKLGGNQMALTYLMLAYVGLAVLLVVAAPRAWLDKAAASSGAGPTPT